MAEDFQPGDAAVVTGASSGLGAAIARRLAGLGAHVVLVARRDDRLRALAAELTAGSADASVVAVDLLGPAAPDQVRAAVVALSRPLKLLVNNAGVGGRGPFATIGYEGVQRVMAINFDAQLRLTEALLPLLRDAAPASVINMGSVAGRIARPGGGAYSASKFALAGWSEALRGEEAGYGVTVSLLQPGFLATEGFPQSELLAHPLSRRLVGRPEQAADAVVDLWHSGRAEQCVPRAWRIAIMMRTLAPKLTMKVAGKPLTTPNAS